MYSFLQIVMGVYKTFIIYLVMKYIIWFCKRVGNGHIKNLSSIFWKIGSCDTDYRSRGPTVLQI